MKCVRCNEDSTYPQRAGKRCPKCKGEFAFEPREGAPFSDTAFANAIKRVSSDGAVRWGVEHLYYELARIKRSKGCLFIFLSIMAVVGAVLVSLTVHFVLGLLVGFTFLVFSIAVSRREPRIRLAQAEFESLWQRWRQVHGEPKGVIVRKPTNPDAPRRAMESDIELYSFDRAVICDRARTVDLLLANNFHFENNCAVLSVGGYPGRAFATVRRMLKRNPRLMIFVLHDATPAGCTLARKLASDPDWFKGVGKVVDVGLRPLHSRALRGLWQERLESTELPELEPGIAAKELAWLKTWTVELAAVRPEQVIKRLFRAISAYPEGAGAGAGGGGGVLVETSDVVYFSTDAGTSDGGGDSFG